MADSVGTSRPSKTLGKLDIGLTDRIDRVFGHALNTVNRIRPGSQKPPPSDRLALYGLYKQSMEGDVSLIADKPSSANQPNISAEQLRKEQEKWDAWKENEGLSRTEAKRRYIERLIETMHKYASQTDEAKQLVEELEFVWDQIKNNSQHSSSEHSSPLQHLERSGYINNSSSGENGGIGSSAAAMEGNTGGASRPLRVLSPVSQAVEDEVMEEDDQEFVDAPVSQVDEGDLNAPYEEDEGNEPKDPQAVARRAGDAAQARRNQLAASPGDARWRKRVENGLFKLTTEVAALREQLENYRFVKNQQKKSFFGWIFRIGWWGIQLVVADAVILWIVLLYLRKHEDRRLEGAIRVLLGDAVAQARKVAGDVKMPTLPKIPQMKAKKGG